MTNNINPSTGTSTETKDSKLYPLKFQPILKPVIWGGSEICRFKGIQPTREGIGESWEISSVKGNVSVVSNGDLGGKTLDELISEYKGALVGRSVYERFGNTFPLLIKFIDARDDLSIQVHPNDKLAKERHGSFGKTEMWYVVKAAPGAFLYSGFEQQITPEEYVERVNNNTFTDTLKRYDVKEGDVFFLPAGRVHAIGAGCFVAEIQQTSDITYRIYDYNRKDAAGNTRELHTEEAKDAIDYSVQASYQTSYDKNKNQPVKLVTSPYFETHLLEMDQPMDRDYTGTDSFVIYICLEGKCTVNDDKGHSVEVAQGGSILIPANTRSVEILPNRSCKLLETRS
jgi:mannose-6-phosphate isomerase